MITKMLLRWGLASLLVLSMLVSVPRATEQTFDRRSRMLKFLTQNVMLLPKGEVAGIKLTEIFGIAKAIDERIPYIIELIKEGNYDIVGLQEAFYDEGRKRIINEWLDGPEDPDWKPAFIPVQSPNAISCSVFYGKAKDKERYYVTGPKVVDGRNVTLPFVGTIPLPAELIQDGGLVILSRYPIVTASAFVYSSFTGADQLASKGALYARIALEEIGVPYIHVFVTHTQAGKENEKIRKKQLEELKKFIDNATKGDNYPIILMGDFNVIANSATLVRLPSGKFGIEWPETEEYGYMKGKLSPLEDVWAKLHPSDLGFTWIGKDWGTKASLPWNDLGNTVAVDRGIPQRLDYFFYFPGVELILDPESIELVPPGPRGTPYCFEPTDGRCELESHTVSDHLGLEMSCKVTPSYQVNGYLWDPAGLNDGRVRGFQELTSRPIMAENQATHEEEAPIAIITGKVLSPRVVIPEAMETINIKFQIIINSNSNSITSVALRQLVNNKELSMEAQLIDPNSGEIVSSWTSEFFWNELLWVIHRGVVAEYIFEVIDFSSEFKINFKITIRGSWKEENWISTLGKPDPGTNKRTIALIQGSINASPGHDGKVDLSTSACITVKQADSRVMAGTALPLEMWCE